jgi:tol-pal system protein YbgF
MVRMPVVFVLVALAAGCASRAQVREGRAELDALRSEVNLLRQAHGEHVRDTSRSLSALPALETRVRDVGAGLGDTTQAVGRFGQSVTQIQEELAQVRGDVKQVQGDLKQVRGELAERPAQAAAPPPREERPSRESPAARQPTPEVDYAHALAAFRSQEHGQAVLEFLDFRAKYPRHALAVNAQYWIGEAYYVQRDYRQAIAEFLKVLDLGSPNGKTADALLKIGLSYERLHDPSRAHQTWERVVSDHPGSEAAVKARGFLRARRTIR